MLTKNQLEAAAKRIADASEKFAIASAALGVYGDNTWAILVAALCMAVSIFLSLRGAR
jgi:hypothetical protein